MAYYQGAWFRGMGVVRFRMVLDIPKIPCTTKEYIYIYIYMYGDKGKLSGLQ